MNFFKRRKIRKLIEMAHWRDSYANLEEKELKENAYKDLMEMALDIDSIEMIKEKIKHDGIGSGALLCVLEKYRIGYSFDGHKHEFVSDATTMELIIKKQHR